jgi:leucyl/phenylalanyl-tRNA--protein transferase
MGEEFPYLSEEDTFEFPSVERATPEGIVGVGGNLSPGMLLSAYRQGVFPWYSDNEPLLWWSPEPRFVLYPEELHVAKRLRRTIRKNPFRITMDRRFSEVIQGCAEVSRPDQEGTWITDDMVEAYTRLHELGYAHSVEVEDPQTNALLGGLYGISLGKAYFGESMFSRAPDASKVGFVVFARKLAEAGFHFIDCQVYTEHLARFGARNISRASYLRMLRNALRYPTCKGKWERFLEADPAHSETSIRTQ